MQSLHQAGVNYFYVDIRLLDGYTFEDNIKIMLSKKNCKDFYFVPTVELCDTELTIKFDIDTCLDVAGIWTFKVLNDSDEIIFQTLVQIIKK